MDRFMDLKSRIYVAGHAGLVGSAIFRCLYHQGYSCLRTRPHAELDLTNAEEVLKFLSEESPEYVFLAAAKVGGIMANTRFPAEFIRQNLAIELNVIDAAYRCGVKRMLFLGSSCIYPKLAPQPLREEHLLSGPLEESNRPYALAKIAGIELCWSYNRQYGTHFLCAMPTNLYGPRDNYDLNMSHVIPGMMRKMHEAKLRGDEAVQLWGTGSPRREFLYSDDLAEACVLLMNLDQPRFDSLAASASRAPLVNIGCGEDLTIRELSGLVAEAVGYRGQIVFDPSAPDGTPRKLLDVSIMRRLGWRPRTNIREGLRSVYADFLGRRTPDEALRPAESQK